MTESPSGDGAALGAVVDAAARLAETIGETTGDAGDLAVVLPSPATYAILILLKAGGCVRHFW